MNTIADEYRSPYSLAKKYGFYSTRRFHRFLRGLAKQKCIHVRELEVGNRTLLNLSDVDRVFVSSSI